MQMLLTHTLFGAPASHPPEDTHRRSPPETIHPRPSTRGHPSCCLAEHSKHHHGQQAPWRPRHVSESFGGVITVRCGKIGISDVSYRSGAVRQHDSGGFRRFVPQPPSAKARNSANPARTTGFTFGTCAVRCAKKPGIRKSYLKRSEIRTNTFHISKWSAHQQ